MGKITLDTIIKFITGIIIPVTIWFTLIRADISQASKDIFELKKDLIEVKEKIYDQLSQIKQDVSEIKGELKHERIGNR